MHSTIRLLWWLDYTRNKLETPENVWALRTAATIAREALARPKRISPY